MNNDDPKPTEDPAPEKETEAGKPKEKKMARNTSKVRAGKKRVAGKAGKSAAKARTGTTRSRIADDDKVIKAGPNKFREGTDAWKRTEAVLKSSGQTVGTIKQKHGKLLLPTTLGNLKRLGIIKIG